MKNTLAYLFLLAVTISAVTPNHGKPGDSVVVTGNEFPTNAQVVFNGAKCKIASQNATSITCNVPQGIGKAEVRIITPESHSAVIKEGFTYDK